VRVSGAERTAAVAPDAPRGPAPVSRVERVAVCVVVAAAVVVRFVTTSHLWLDEALTVNISRLPLGDIPEALRHDGHPPLYYFVLHGWIAVFGHTDVAVRALSGLFGVIALPLGWLAGRRLGGQFVAWAMLLLLAVSPFAIRYSTETRMYSLAMVLVLVGYLLVRDALERATGWRLVAIAVVTGALLLTHYWALWLAGAVLVALGLRWWRWDAADEALDPEGRRRLVVVGAAVAAGGLLFLPWLPSLLYQAAHTGTPWAPPLRPVQAMAIMIEDFGGGAQGETVLTGFVFAALFALGLFGRNRGRFRIELDWRTVPPARSEALVCGLALAIGVAVGFLSSTTFQSRYAALFLPLALLVAAVGLAAFGDRLSRGIAALVVIALATAGAYLNVTSDRTQAAQIASAIRAGAQPGDVVVYCPDQLGPSVQRLLPDGFEGFTFPDFGPPDRVDWVDYAERSARSDPDTFVDELVQRVPEDQTIWLVVASTYRTLERQCADVASLLGSARPGSSVLVADNGTDFYEHGSLVRAPGSTAAGS
jgi:hypothetical protein